MARTSTEDLRTPSQAAPRSQYDTAAIMGGLYGDGIIALKGAFERGWVQRVGEDIEQLFQEAVARPGGALGRGPNRYYVEIHPERLRGFVDLVTHPWVVAVCEAVLGPDYKVVELGFDIPFPGAQNQPWHRDFPAPAETVKGRRLNSLAFNLTTVNVTEDMGPFEIAPGTQWDESPEFEQGRFPPSRSLPGISSAPSAGCRRWVTSRPPLRRAGSGAHRGHAGGFCPRRGAESVPVARGVAASGG